MKDSGLALSGILDKVMIPLGKVFTNGVLLQTFHKNGRIHFEYPMRDNEFHGLCRQWDENGVLRVDEFYHKGFLQGCRWEFDERGKICLQERYAFYGLKEGVRTLFDRNGRVKSRTLFVRGGAVDNWLHVVINTREILARDILKITDDEIRRVCIDELGYEDFLRQVEYRVIAGEGQSTLIRVNLLGKKRYFYFLRAYVKATGIWYLFQAPNDAKTIQQAFSWALERPGGAWPRWTLNCYPA